MTHALQSPPGAAVPQETSHPAGVGALLRAWRDKRRLSQMALALEAGISPRHLSFVETGRSRPSAELIMALAQTLNLPLRERNQLLLAGGFAPRHPHSHLGAPDLSGAQRALQRLLTAHDPYPGLAMDRHWNVVLTNRAAGRMLAMLPPQLAQPPVNLFKACLHPQGFSAVTDNFDEWGRYLVHQLVRMEAATLDPVATDLLAEVRGYPKVRALAEAAGLQAPESDALLVPCSLRLPQGLLSMFTAQASFGSPREVTLAELTVELFYPVDEASAALLEAQARA